MARQFKRSYELTVIPTTGEAIIIRGLKVEFEITKSLLSFPNLARIKVFNPNATTISALQAKFTKIVFNAGYEGNLRLLFQGEIRNVFQGRLGEDFTAEIYAGDGQRDLQSTSFSKTFSENVSLQTIFKEVAGQFLQSTIGTLEGVPDVKDKLRGQTFSGNAKAILDNMAEEYGFSWSIQDGEVVTTPDEEPLTGGDAVLISSTTGMIGTPTVTEIGADVTVLLNPSLLPNNAFEIRATSADVQLGNAFFRNAPRTQASGFYKVQEVIFRGDSREGAWSASVKGRSLNV